MEKRITPMKAIRAKCLECAGTSNEVKLCPIPRCALYPLRSGHKSYDKRKREQAENETDAE